MVPVTFLQDAQVGNSLYNKDEVAGFDLPVAEKLVADGIATLGPVMVAEDVVAPDGEVLIAEGSEIVADANTATVVSEPAPEAE